MIGPLTTPACAGGDGTSTATVTSSKKITGLVYGAYVQFVGDDPATTDLTIATLGTTPNQPAHNILVRADSAADGLLLPRMDIHTFSTGAAQTVNNALIAINDFVVVTVAQANDGDVCNVWLFVIKDTRL